MRWWAMINYDRTLPPIKAHVLSLRLLLSSYLPVAPDQCLQLLLFQEIPLALYWKVVANQADVRRGNHTNPRRSCALPVNIPNHGKNHSL